MTKAKRLQFLKKRFGRPKGLFSAKPRLQETPKKGYRFDTFGVPQHLTELRQKRVYLPDPKPELRLATKRMQRASPLTNIAQKWGTPEWFHKRSRALRHLKKGGELDNA